MRGKKKGGGRERGEAALTRQKTSIKLDKVIFINGSLFFLV